MGLFDNIQQTGLFQGFQNRVMPFAQNNNMALLGAGMGLLSGEGWGAGAQGFMQGAQADQQRGSNQLQQSLMMQDAQRKQQLFDQGQQDRKLQQQQTNATQQWFQKNMPDYANAPVEVQRSAIQSMFGGTKPTTAIQEYEYAKSQDPSIGSFVDYQSGMKKAGAQNITVGGGRYGTIPQGYQLIEGPDGARMAPIPGGPEDTSKSDMAKAGQAEVASRTVTNASKRALEAAKDRQLGGLGQGIIGAINPYSDSAEVQRQVEVLKSNAKVENLNAMRAASPTGGALGSVTEKEGAMLADKSGALDPSSPNFERDLLDYELTLLQVIHGPEVGARIFQQNHSDQQDTGGDWQTLPNGVRIREKR